MVTGERVVRQYWMVVCRMTLTGGEEVEESKSRAEDQMVKAEKGKLL